MSEHLRFDIKVDNVAAVAAFEGLARALQSLSSRTAGVERVLAMPGAAGATQNLQRLAYQSGATAAAMGGLGNPQVLQGLEGFRGKVMTIASAMVGMQIGMTTVSKAMDYLMSTFSKGSQLLNMSRSTGQTVSDLVTMEKALKAVNIPAESLRTYLFMLNRSMAAASSGAGGLGKAFGKMGLDAEALKKMGAKEQMLAIAEGLKKLSSQAEQTQALRQIFGRSGPQLMAAFKDEGFIKTLQGGSSEYAKLMERNAKLFDSIDNGLKALSSRFKEFASVIAEAIGPMLDMMLKQFKQFDGASAAKRFAIIADALKVVISYINLGIQAIGTIVEWFGRHATAVTAVVKGMIALGISFAALKLADFIKNLGAKVNTFVRSALAIKAETQAVNENSAALMRNNAARGVGAGGVIGGGGGGFGPRGPVPNSGANLNVGQLRALQLAGVAPGQTIIPYKSYNPSTGMSVSTATETKNNPYMTAPLGTGASESALKKLSGAAGEAGNQVGFLTKQMNATSAAGLMAAANIGIFIGSLVAFSMVNTISQLESLRAELEQFGNDLDDERKKRGERSSAPKTKEEKDQRVKESQTELDVLEQKYLKAKTAREEFEKTLSPAERRTGTLVNVNDKVKRDGLAALEEGRKAEVERKKKELENLKSINDSSLLGGGGHADFVEIGKALSGSSDTLRELLNDEKWASTVKHVQKIASELKQIGERSIELNIEIAKDPTERIKLLNDLSQKRGEEFNKNFGRTDDTLGINLMGKEVAPTEENAASLMNIATTIKERVAIKAEELKLDKDANNWTTEEGKSLAGQLLIASALEKLSKETLSAAKQKLKDEQEINDRLTQQAKRRSELSSLEARAKDNIALEAQINRQQRLVELTAEYDKLQKKDPAAFAKEFGANATPGSAAQTVADAEIRAKERDAKLSRDKVESELAVVAALSKGDSVEAARLTRAQKIKDLTKEYAEMLIKADSKLTDSEAKKRATEMATQKVDDEQAPAREKSGSELMALRLRVQGREQEAVAVERIQKIKEKEKQYADQGFGSKSGAMAKEFVQNEETLKYRKAAPRLTDSLRSVGMDINTHAFSGGGDYRAMGQGGGLGYRAIGQSGGGAGYKGFASAGIDMRSPYEKARGAVGAKGAEAIGPMRQMGPEEYARSSAASLKNIDKNTAPKKTDDPNRGLT